MLDDETLEKISQWAFNGVCFCTGALSTVMLISYMLTGHF